METKFVFYGVELQTSAKYSDGNVMHGGCLASLVNGQLLVYKSGVATKIKCAPPSES